MVSKVRNLWLCVFSGVVATTLMYQNSILKQNFVLFQNLSFFDHPSNSIGALTTRLATEANSVKDATGRLVC